MSVVSSTGQTILRKDQFSRYNDPNIRQNLDPTPDTSQIQSEANFNRHIHRDRKLVDQVDGLLHQQHATSKGFPQKALSPKALYDERSIISVSQEPQSRFLFAGQSPP